jgi:predicted RNA-binding protein (virulence factor B family)
MPAPRRHVVVPNRRLLGRTVMLRVERVTAAGAWLAAVDLDEARRHDEAERAEGADDTAPVLLPKREVPGDAAVGDAVSVFVTLDSDDRPVATTRRPHVQLGEVAFLRVSATTQLGAFVDWGLPKELLVPFREQTRDVKVGERHPVGLRLDKSGRLVGTMRVSELLRATPVVAAGEWVAGELWRTDPPLGSFVIVERRFVGLVPASEPHGLARGDTAMFRVTRVLADGKFELSLRGTAHEEITDDAAHVLAILARPATPPVGDHSTPAELRAHFGLSKKAFKRALGRLLRDGAVTLRPDGSAMVGRAGATAEATERGGARATERPASPPARRRRRPDRRPRPTPR